MMGLFVCFALGEGRVEGLIKIKTNKTNICWISFPWDSAWCALSHLEQEGCNFEDQRIAANRSY